ncbi:hypothetical protein A9Q91_01215 [Candidatus Gracilibacteria bacterium 28_42_T64]|nr:hypothetical protein A9Q91_01215 [Candidatus Gracilibacteria bacterium 28_42_T64]
MKYIYIIMVTLILASCSNNVVVEDSEVVEKTTSDIDTELLVLDTEDTDNSETESEEGNIEAEEENIEEKKVVKLSAKYNNPQQEVDMMVNYSLDENDKIKTIEVIASNWDLSDFNTAAQVVIGKTLKEASDASIAGASLTTAAFNNALKK